MPRHLPVILACLGLASCRSAARDSASDPTRNWASVATISGSDIITTIHLNSLLKSKGIECVTEGSVGYDLRVPRRQQAAAARLIEEDLRHRAFALILHTPKGDVPYSSSAAGWTEWTPKAHYETLLADPRCAASTDLGAALRFRMLADDLPTFPYVMRVRSLERDYLDTDGRLHTAHEFAIDLAVKPDECIAQAWHYLQVWADGRHILWQGGGETWSGTPDAIARNRATYDKRPHDRFR